MDVRRADGADELRGEVAVWNAITPREPVSVEAIEERWARQPERLYLLAEERGQAVGTAMVAPSDSPGRLFLDVRVLDEARRHGIGAALYEQVEAHALALEPEALSASVSEASFPGFRFAWLRGYREVGRQVELVRTLRGDEQPPPLYRDVEIVELTDKMRSDAYILAREAWADFPVGFAVSAPSWDDWVREEFDGPIAFAARLKGRLIGYAALMSRPVEGLLEHGLTAVKREYRGHGIGTALKQMQIAWAAAHGYRELITFTQQGNDAMRRVNEKLGYDEQPAWLTMRRDLA
jgi:GNAT superfamily N-acetyltransferase